MIVQVGHRRDSRYCSYDFFFFFQAEDGIRDLTVTGVRRVLFRAPVRVVPETCRQIPFENDTLFFLSEFAPPAEAICPRGILRKMVEKARGMGFEPYGAVEYEFFLFEETAHSVRQKNYRDLKPIS